MVVCSRLTVHQFNTDTRNLVLVLTKKGNNKFTCPFFDNRSLSSSKQLKICSGYFIFPIKQEDISDYNPRCFISSGLMIGDIIMDQFYGIIEQNKIQKKKIYFPK